MIILGTSGSGKSTIGRSVIRLYDPTGGKITIDMSELPYEKEGYVLFCTKVTDTGVGISEDFIPHLFDEFSREKSSTESKPSNSFTVLKYSVSYK